ncbi:MAG TPA: hypothetical protein DD438_09030 [Verrucomicrobiales bacterium]|nr:hypothetical protein [Verrucomicrobiales bacterium]|tara:strand:+ start:54 stop:251 length:198 start_codon:yes stop_codon:yes gene_type:complete
MKFLFLVPLLAALLVAGCGEKQEVVSFLENGQKAGEHTYKDGELVFGKYWNSKGEEVETFKEAIK